MYIDIKKTHKANEYFDIYIYKISYNYLFGKCKTSLTSLNIVFIEPKDIGRSQ